MSTYVLVHPGWHTGAELEPVAALLRETGHQVFTPTLKGNRPGDVKAIGLEEQIQSAVDFLSENNLNHVILLGYSSGGFIITGVADRAASRIRRLVYCNAFVANNGEAITDQVPPYYPGLLTQLGDGSVSLPFPIWREAYINDADLETAQRAYDKLNPQPFKTFTDKIVLRTESDRDDAAEVLHQLHGRYVSPPWLRLSSDADRQSSDCSGSSRCLAVMKCASRTRRDLAQAIIEAGRD